MPRPPILLFPLLLSWFLPGCAAPPPAPLPVAVAAAHAPAGTRGALARVALREWEAWGRLVVTGWAPVLDNGARPAPENFPRVLSYWDAVPAEGPGVIARHRELHDSLTLALDAEWTGPAPLPDISLWAYPFWSAAFISYAMREAGVGEGDFIPAAAHSRYVDALLSRAGADPDNAAFIPHEPLDFAPRPGDLVCADRSRSPISSWTERLGEPGQFRPMHCDVVVTVRPGLLESVGGNLKDAVALRRLPADGRGRLLPAPDGEAPFFAVFENRLGLPLPGAPAASVPRAAAPVAAIPGAAELTPAGSPAPLPPPTSGAG